MTFPFFLIWAGMQLENFKIAPLLYIPALVCNRVKDIKAFYYKLVLIAPC